MYKKKTLLMNYINYRKPAFYSTLYVNQNLLKKFLNHFYALCTLSVNE